MNGIGSFGTNTLHLLVSIIAGLVGNLEQCVGDLLGGVVHGVEGLWWGPWVLTALLLPILHSHLVRKEGVCIACQQ